MIEDSRSALVAVPKHSPTAASADRQMASVCLARDGLERDEDDNSAQQQHRQGEDHDPKP